MPFDLDCSDSDFRAHLSDGQAPNVAPAAPHDAGAIEVVPTSILRLTLGQLVGLHVPHRRPGPVRLSTLGTALRRLRSQLRATHAGDQLSSR